MTIQAFRFPPKMDLDHLELGWNVLAESTVRPIANAVYYCFPWLGAFFAYCLEMRENDPAQETMMPTLAKISILHEIKDLTKAAKLLQPVIVYTSLKHSFASYGGRFSITAPALCIPYQHIFRAGNHPLWNYSDEETSFLIARELGCIRHQSALLRLATKISVLTMAGFFGGWAIATLSFIAAHCLLERHLQGKMDLWGVDILAARFGDAERAAKAALGALQKMQQQNLSRVKTNPLCRFYVTQAGDNFLDWTHPTLSSRIGRIQKTYLV